MFFKYWLLLTSDLDIIILKAILHFKGIWGFERVVINSESTISKWNKAESQTSTFLFEILYKTCQLSMGIFKQSRNYFLSISCAKNFGKKGIFTLYPI
jgi:hypothetical protein